MDIECYNTKYLQSVEKGTKKFLSKMPATRLFHLEYRFEMK
jgi:hypothetical protein